MTLIDTHCHLYAQPFETDIDEVIDRALNQGVQKFYLPAIDNTTHKPMLALQNKYPKNCFAMMGLHPCSVKENYADELQIVQDWLGRQAFAAIGEIGLDFYWDKTYETQQYKAFGQQIEWALQYKLPIIIHTRSAMQQTIEVLEDFKSVSLTGIFHCFSGTYQDAVKIIDRGFYLGIGGVITYKNTALAQVIEKIDTEHLVLETDAPYLAPVPFRGKRNESCYLKYVAEKIATLKNISVSEVARITTANAQKIFGV